MTDFALGTKVRALRRQQRMSQSELARRLGISASYMNLIEHNRRAFGAELLVKLADILEVFGDPLFEGVDPIAQEVQEVATASPSIANGVLRLYAAYRAARESAQSLAETLSRDQQLNEPHQSRFPHEEVGDFIQRHMNFFPELEEGAEKLAREAGLDQNTLFPSLVRYLKQAKGVEVRIEQVRNMQSALRRYDPKRKVLQLSEVLRRGSRNFQLAHQVGLLTQGDVLDQIVADPLLTTDEARSSCRVALASYFAAAVLMPYQPFFDAARQERYDIELLGHRFRTSFEQVCHRLTTLRHPGSEGIPFHMLRVDIAGNMSKRFSASGLRIPRYSGACPRWNVFGAFATPGVIHTQVSRFPDGQTFFGVARTVRKGGGGFHGASPLFAISMGCDISRASELVYADGLDLSNSDAIVPVGPSCRLCERTDCEQRATPPIGPHLSIDENRRGVSFYVTPPSGK
jgi:predicted transcriptional regulator/DNA-binding XRE family transcriptional regulator